MTATLPLDLPEAPKVLRAHERVCTLPSLLMSLQDLARFASESGAKGPINLADFDPTHGVNVSLNDDGSGVLFIKLKRNRS